MKLFGVRHFRNSTGIKRHQSSPIIPEPLTATLIWRPSVRSAGANRPKPTGKAFPSLRSKIYFFVAFSSSGKCCLFLTKCWRKVQGKLEIFWICQFLESFCRDCFFSSMKAISWNGNIWFKQVDDLPWRKESPIFLKADMTSTIMKVHDVHHESPAGESWLWLMRWDWFVWRGAFGCPKPHQGHWFEIFRADKAAKKRSQWWEHPLQQRISMISISWNNNSMKGSRLGISWREQNVWQSNHNISQQVTLHVPNAKETTVSNYPNSEAQSIQAPYISWPKHHLTTFSWANYPATLRPN